VKKFRNVVVTGSLAAMAELRRFVRERVRLLEPGAPFRSRWLAGDCITPSRVAKVVTVSFML